MDKRFEKVLNMLPKRIDIKMVFDKEKLILSAISIFDGEKKQNNYEFNDWLEKSETPIKYYMDVLEDMCRAAIRTELGDKCEE